MKTAIGFVFVMVVLACSSGGTTGASACKSAGQKLCAKAATCAGDGKARIVSGGTDGGSGGATITFSTESGCSTLYSIGCDNPSPDAGAKDYAACLAALDTAMCGTSMSGNGVISPPECK